MSSTNTHDPELNITIGSEGTHFCGSDRYSFKVVDITSRFKKGQHKGLPRAIKVREGDNRETTILTFRPSGGIWARKGEVRVRGHFYTFKHGAINFIDPNF
jgi:hypothetical protein